MSSSEPGCSTAQVADASPAAGTADQSLAALASMMQAHDFGRAEQHWETLSEAAREQAARAALPTSADRLLHLAVDGWPESLCMIGHLLRAGADPRSMNTSMEHAIYRAFKKGDRDLIRILYRKAVALDWRDWKEAMPRIQQVLGSLPDCIISLKWRISSWIPFLALLAPSDTWTFRKTKSALRVDWTLMGWHNMKSIRGSCSCLFRIDEANLQGQCFQICHHEQWFVDITDKIENPSADEIESEIDKLLAAYRSSESDVAGPSSSLTTSSRGRQQRQLESAAERESNAAVERDGGANSSSSGMAAVVDREEPERETAVRSPRNHRPAPDGAEIAVESIQIVPKRGLFSTEQKETTVSGFHCKVYEIQGVKVIHDGRSTDYNAVVWMAEDFPISKEHILAMMEIIAPMNPDFARVKQFLAVELPNGFPVKMDVPIFTATSAILVMNKIKLEPSAESVFEVPLSYARVRTFEDIVEIRRHLDEERDRAAARGPPPVDDGLD